MPLCERPGCYNHPDTCSDCWRVVDPDTHISMRQFDSGATRNNDADSLDYEGFLSPLVLQRFAVYMHKHRRQADGTLRDSDNWQKGIPRDAYMKSGLRHVVDWWSAHRGLPSREGLQDALCAVIFNACGYLHELLTRDNDGTST